MKRPPGRVAVILVSVLLPILVLFLFPSFVNCQSSDDEVMFKLRVSLGNASSLGWSGDKPCKWPGVQCEDGTRVTRIKISGKGVKGYLPSDLSNLGSLQQLEVDGNNLNGSVPKLSGSGSSVEYVNLRNNIFSSIPPDFFSGLTGLKEVYLDKNPFQAWTIPDSLKQLTLLRNFSASNANITGSIPNFLFSGDSMTALSRLQLAYNQLQGPLPATSSGSFLSHLALNGQKLDGSIAVLQNMTHLIELDLQGNNFTGPIPDFSGPLEILNLRENKLTGIVPASLTKISSLKIVNLTNNFLQGPTPKFNSSVEADIKEINRFCLDKAGAECDIRVNNLLSAVEGFGYPRVLAESWGGNDPCDSWKGVQCLGKDIIVVNFNGMGLTGSISPGFSSITSLQKLILSNNNLTGTIPSELSKLPNLKVLDVSRNNLHGKVPIFNGTSVITDGNPDIGKEISTPPGQAPGGSNPENEKSSSSGKKTVGFVIGAACVVAVLVVVGLFIYCRRRKRYTKVQSPNTMVIHPRYSGNQGDAVKITIAPRANNGASSTASSSDIHVVEAGTMVISIQVLREVTDNFSQDNILGRGGFGTVYKGELHDGTKIAVKRMESAAVVNSDTGLAEFTSEIAVLTKVRHRHLVSLLGYCLDGNEKILVYEYMPQGTLSRFLFNWKYEGLQPLEWTRRLTIALDVGRAVEYLHGLAHQSFIHRDLKPSNILLGDDMRAKVADFGLVRLAPEGQNSVSTRLAGTFGYMAPEYAVTGRVTIKVDVFSFGVILMELISGRRALDERETEDKRHLVPWFRRMHMDKNKFPQAIDSSIELNEETLASITTVADLAGHCTSREPYQRPDMSHVVNTLSTLAELWKPERSRQEDTDDEFAPIDLNMSLPQALKKWQEIEDVESGGEFTSKYGVDARSTRSSTGTRPSGFAETFPSTDAR
ncbi:Receptor protein kinase TMK1 [Linum perenne]